MKARICWKDESGKEHRGPAIHEPKEADKTAKDLRKLNKDKEIWVETEENNG